MQDKKYQDECSGSNIQKGIPLFGGTYYHSEKKTTVVLRVLE